MSNFGLNRPQLNKILNKAEIEVEIWGRGTGKSFLLGWDVRDTVLTFPRGTFVFHGSTYIDMLSNTLPTTLGALGRLGWINNVHYVIGKRPDKRLNFAEPFDPVLEPERVIWFANGTVFALSSQDRTKRGSNVDGILADEGLLLKKDKFESDLIPTNRGNLDRFGHIPWHHFIKIYSSMPYTNDGDWLLQYGEYYENKGAQYSIVKELLGKKERAFIDSLDKNVMKVLWKEICELKKELKYYTYRNDEGQTVFYQEADCLDNILNVGLASIRRQRSLMTDLSFGVEMLNERPTKPKDGGFYPNFDLTKHSYIDQVDYGFTDNFGFDFNKLKERNCLFDADRVAFQKLEISIDWGNFNSMTVFQKVGNEERLLNKFYVQPPNIIDDLAKMFCDYYSPHLSRDVDMRYDRNGNNTLANSNLTYAEQFAKVLRSFGWNVNMLTTGLDPFHNDKFLLINIILSEKREGWPVFRMNYSNAREVAMSIMGAGIIREGKIIKKDKRSEKRKSIKPQHATHLSDTVDIHLYSKYSYLLDDIEEGFSMLSSS